MRSWHLFLLVECLVLVAGYTGWLSLQLSTSESTRILSLMLLLTVWDRSMIRCHLFERWFLNLMMWASDLLNGPATRLCYEKFWQPSIGLQYPGAAKHTPGCALLIWGAFETIQKPSEITVIKNCTSPWLGWVARSDIQFPVFEGVVTAMALCITLRSVCELDRWAPGTRSWYGEQMSYRWIQTMFSAKRKRLENIAVQKWVCNVCIIVILNYVSNICSSIMKQSGNLLQHD